jgi:hypothetical protein
VTPTPPTQPAAPQSVTESDPQTLAWTALADELTPAKSLARIEAATTRVITNVTVVGTILTGLGLLGAGLSTITGTARGLAIAAAAAAAAAVACALAAQVLTIRTNLNTRNIQELKTWYRQQFRRRAYPTRAATILLISAILLAGAATTTALMQPLEDKPVIGITQTQISAAETPTQTPRTTVAVEVTFRDLTPTDTLTLTVTAGNTTIARAATTPQLDGTATRTITIPDIPNNTHISATASAAKQTCTATLKLDQGKQPEISC